MLTEQGSNIGGDASQRAQDLGQQPYQNRGLGWSSRRIFSTLGGAIADTFSSERRARIQLGSQLKADAARGIVRGTVDNAVSSQAQVQSIQNIVEHAINPFREKDEEGNPRTGPLTEDEQRGIPQLYTPKAGGFDTGRRVTETIGRSDSARKQSSDLAKQLKDLQQQHKEAQSTIADLQEQIKNANPVTPADIDEVNDKGRKPKA
jgi:hypothetical protein